MREVCACYNLDKHERCWNDDLYSLFFSSESEDEMGPLLTRPARTSSIIHLIEEKVLPGLFGESTKIGQFTTLKKSPILEKLPNEVLYVICGCINGLDNIISFALTCPRFWGIAKPHIVRVRDAVIAETSWAGDHIICVREHSNDWPSSIPEKERESYLSKDEWPIRNNNGSLLEVETNIIYLGMNKLERDAYDWICQSENVYDRGDPVLRNISKKVYVNQRGLDELLDDFQPPTHRLAHIALSKNCWSSEPPRYINYQGPIHRGEWAGDRLDIVSFDRHTKEIEDATLKYQEGLPGNVGAEQSSPVPSSSSTSISGNRAEWKDVTDECVELLDNIWKAQNGRKWLKQLVNDYYREYYGLNASDLDTHSDSEQDLTDESI